MTDDQPNDQPTQALQSDDSQTKGLKSAYGTDSQANSRSTKYQFPLRRVIIVGLIAIAIGCLAQWFAPQFDHQNANMICMLALILFSLHLLWVSQRAASSHGNRWVVPMITAAMIGSAVALLRFDGFSGEMLPQYSWRFSPARMDLKQIADGGTAHVVNDQDLPGERQANSDRSVAARDSDQFLGPDRTAVISERLFAVPETNGETIELWNQGIGEGWAAFAVVGDRAVTMEQRGDTECVTCYRLADGELLWIDKYKARHENPLGGIGPRATPTVFDGRVFANGATGYLRCLDLKTGERVWTTDLKELAGWNQAEFDAAAPWGHASSPLVIESLGICVLGFGGLVNAAEANDQGITPTDKGLIAIDLMTGKERWRGGHDQFSYASPVLMQSIGQIVAVNEKTLSGHVPETGEQLWSFPWPGSTSADANCASAMLAGDGQFIVGKGYGGGSALLQITQQDDKWDAREIWTSSRVLKTKFNHTCILGDLGFGLNNGSLQAARISTGDPLWTQPRRSRSGQGQVILVEDVLVVQSEPGDVVFVAAVEDAYRELGRLSPLSSKTWNVPTIAGRHLVVRNDRQAVCYLLPAK